jgi:hypothetical protein
MIVTFDPRSHTMRNLPAAILLWVCWLSSLACGSAPEQVPLFVSGEGGYHTYRIPAIVVSPRGAVLTFCEGRKTSARDDGDIDLLRGAKDQRPRRRRYRPAGAAEP